MGILKRSPSLEFTLNLWDKSLPETITATGIKTIHEKMNFNASGNQGAIGVSESDADGVGLLAIEGMFWVKMRAFAAT